MRYLKHVNGVVYLRVKSGIEGDGAAVEHTVHTSWTFLTNHSHVLLCLARDPEVRMRDVAREVGITERAVQRIVADLDAAGHITREKHGRRNSYRVNRETCLRHPLEEHRTVGDLLDLLVDSVPVPSRTEGGSDA